MTLGVYVQKSGHPLNRLLLQAIFVSFCIPGSGVAHAQLDIQAIKARGLSVNRSQHLTLITDVRDRADVTEFNEVFEAAVQQWCEYFEIPPAAIGDWHLTGCVIDNDCFIATGSTVFNGARLEEAVEVRINGVVHINTRLESGAVVPIGWVAVGDPAKIYPASEHEKIWEIQSALDFPGTVFGVDRDVSKAERTKRYARYLAKHSADRIVD